MSIKTKLVTAATTLTLIVRRQRGRDPDRERGHAQVRRDLF